MLYDPSDYFGGLMLPKDSPNPLRWPWARVRWLQWDWQRRIELTAELDGKTYSAPGELMGQELLQAARRLWMMAARDQGLSW